jgi:hypothetical protein
MRKVGILTQSSVNSRTVTETRFEVVITLPSISPNGAA